MRVGERSSPTYRQDARLFLPEFARSIRSGNNQSAAERAAPRSDASGRSSPTAPVEEYSSYLFLFALVCRNDAPEERNDVTSEAGIRVQQARIKTSNSTTASRATGARWAAFSTYLISTSKLVSVPAILGGLVGRGARSRKWQTIDEHSRSEWSTLQES